MADRSGDNEKTLPLVTKLINRGYYQYKKDDDIKKQFYDNVLQKIHHNATVKTEFKNDMVVMTYESDAVEDFYHMMQDLVPDLNKQCDPQCFGTVEKIKEFLEKMRANPGASLHLDFDLETDDQSKALDEIKKLSFIKKYTLLHNCFIPGIASFSRVYGAEYTDEKGNVKHFLFTVLNDCMGTYNPPQFDADDGFFWMTSKGPYKPYRSCDEDYAKWQQTDMSTRLVI